jgi:hypothetical protein
MLKPGVLVRWHYLTYYVSAVQGDKADLYSHCIQRRRAGGYRHVRCCVYAVPVTQLELVHRQRRTAA